MYGPAQVAYAFAVDDTDVQDTCPAAFLQVIGHQGFDITGPEGMQIKRTVYWKMNGIVTVHCF